MMSFPVDMFFIILSVSPHHSAKTRMWNKNNDSIASHGTFKNTQMWMTNFNWKNHVIGKFLSSKKKYYIIHGTIKVHLDRR